MNTKERTQEQISALIDGELSETQLEIALAALRNPDSRADWDVYHQIGDAMRSDDMAFSLSPDFSTRMAARLAAEPAIIAPAIVREAQPAPRIAAAGGAAIGKFKRLAMPGMAAAAVATAVFVTTPHLLVAKKENASTAGSAIVMVASPTQNAPVQSAPEVRPVAAVEPKMVTLDQQEGVVLRDPRIDEYLMAHQRFSPSVMSTAQYARSATFAADSGK